MKISRNKLRIQRKKRISAKIRGTKSCPRLAVFKSLKNIYVQVIDDEAKKTIAAADGRGIKAKTRIELGEKIGEAIAKKCLELNLSQVVFDRSGYKYHGQVKALAEGARKNGLRF